ncbi:hypothetical protein MXD81_53780 [Microbacteriaceae bacterium K1510]|nr:hypothetical protein [Microbacteriaceae bacterium K1510]
MADAIEIVVRRLPGGKPTAVGRVVAIATLHEVDGGHGVFARVVAPRPWGRRGFVAADRREEIWRVVAKAAAWAANEAEKLP